MKSTRAIAFVLVAFFVGWMTALGCGSTPPANPLGGPINTGGKPDPNKTEGTISTGGEPNTGGAPDVNKTQGTISPGGPVNSGGKPDVKKSVPGGSK